MTTMLPNTWTAQVQALLQEETDRLIPAGADPTGVAAWLRALARLTVNTHHRRLLVGVVAREAWKDDTPRSPTTLALRFAEAKIGRPNEWLVLYRAAAIGAFLAYGATGIEIAETFGWSTHGEEFYRVIRRAEQYRGHSTRLRTLLPILRRGAPAAGFSRWVGAQVRALPARTFRPRGRALSFTL